MSSEEVMRKVKGRKGKNILMAYQNMGSGKSQEQGKSYISVDGRYNTNKLITKTGCLDRETFHIHSKPCEFDTVTRGRRILYYSQWRKW